MAIATAACGRDETPATMEVQSATPVQQTAAPVTVEGCLRAGEASDTFVLTTARSGEDDRTATYHLVGVDGVDLRAHVGRRVWIDGVLSAQQRVASQTTTDPAPNTQGTSGSPAVSTNTQLDIKRVDVRQVRPLAGSCEM